jgi:hypothetical protein
LILADQTLSEDQKQALVRIYLSFRRDYENEHRHGHEHDHDHDPAPDAPPLRSLS